MQENLGFAVQTQQKREWCWAAVSVSLAGHLNTASFTQCQFATHVTGDTCCPVDSYDGPAGNTPQVLPFVLLQVGLPTSPPDGPVGMDVLVQHIGGHRRPVPIQIRWKDTDVTHFVYIDGYITNPNNPDLNSVQVRDPIAGTRQLWFRDLESKYPPSQVGSNVFGEWFGTFLLQPANG